MLLNFPPILIGVQLLFLTNVTFRRAHTLEEAKLGDGWQTSCTIIYDQDKNDIMVKVKLNNI